MISTMRVSTARILVYGLLVYFPLTIYEFASATSYGSLLRYYGLSLVFLFLINIKQAKQKIRIDKPLSYLMIWLFICILSLLWTSNISLGTYYTFAMGNIILITLIYSNVKFSVKDIRRLRLLFQISALIFGILMVINADYYLRSSDTRHTLLIGENKIDPNNISGLILPAIFLALDDMIRFHKRYILNSVTIAFVLLGMAMSASRGGFVGLAAGLVMYLVIYLFKYRQTAKLRQLMILSIVMVAIIYVVIENVDPLLLNRVFGSSYMVDEGSGRLIRWRNSLAIFQSSPIFGAGLGSVALATHNHFLRVMAETGILGLSAFLYSQYLMITNAYRNRNYEIVAMLVSMWAVIFFLDAYQHKYMWNVIIIYFVVTSNRPVFHDNKNNNETSIQEKRMV